MGSPARPRSSTRPGLRALALAGAGLFAMAVMGAAPGSPYQPLLTWQGQPGGPLTALARAVHLDRLEGNAPLILSILISVLAAIAFMRLLRSAIRGHVAVRDVAIAVVLAHLVLLFVPLLFSRDVYSYAFYGRIAGIYGGNPYVQTPLDHSGDLLWSYVGAKWVDTPAVYGPAWTRVSETLARFYPRPVDHVEVYRILAIVASLATCAAIVWVVRSWRPDRTAFALAAFGLNPVVLYHSVASGHNDIWVALAIVVAIGLVARERVPAAVAVLTLGALVKAVAVLPLILLFVWLLARSSPDERRGVFLRSAATVIAIGLVFAVPYLQLHDPTLGMVELSTHEGWLAPSMGVERLVDLVSFSSLGAIARIAALLLLVLSFLALARRIWRMGGACSLEELGASWAWSLLLLTLLGPVLLPWYVAWTLPLAWLLPSQSRTALIATGALLGVTLWSAEPLRFIGAFTVNVVAIQWLVVPTLLVLLFWVLRDLRHRLSADLALSDAS